VLNYAGADSKEINGVKFLSAEYNKKESETPEIFEYKIGEQSAPCIHKFCKA
jgi:hypothetical protein